MTKKEKHAPIANEEVTEHNILRIKIDDGEPWLYYKPRKTKYGLTFISLANGRNHPRGMCKGEIVTMFAVQAFMGAKYIQQMPSVMMVALLEYGDTKKGQKALMQYYKSRGIAT